MKTLLTLLWLTQVAIAGPAYHPSPDCPFFPPPAEPSQENPLVGYINDVEKSLELLKCDAAKSFRTSLQALRKAHEQQVIGKEVYIEPILPKINEAFDWYLRSSSECYGGQAQEVIEQEVYRVSIDTISLLAAAEPIPGVASVGIALAGTALKVFIDNSYHRKSPEFFKAMMQKTQNTKRLGCLFLEGTQKKLGCEMNPKKPTPKTFLPGTKSDSGIEYSDRSTHDYLFGSDGAKDGSLRKLSTIYDQLQAQRVPQLLKADGSDPGQELMNHYVYHLVGTLGQSVPDISMLRGPERDPRKPMRVDQFEIETEKPLIKHLVEIHRFLAEERDKERKRAETEKKQFRDRPINANAMLRATAQEREDKQIEGLGRFLEAYEKVNPEHPTFEQSQEFAKAVLAHPFRVDEVVKMYWRKYNRPGLPNPVSSLMQDEMDFVKQNKMARHDELLYAYNFHTRPPQSSDKSKIDAARADFAKSYDFFLTQTKPVFTEELKQTSETMIASSGNVKTIGDRTAFFNSYVLPVLQYCSLVAGSFYREPQEGVAPKRPILEALTQILPIPVASRQTFETHCRRFQCEGGLPELPTKAMDEKDAAALDKFECGVIQNYSKIAQNLLTRFQQNPNINAFCYNEIKRPRKNNSAAPSAGHKIIGK